MQTIKRPEDALESADMLANKAFQLSGLLSVLYGESGESFRNLNDEIQDAVLWLASDMANEVRELTLQAAYTGPEK